MANTKRRAPRRRATKKAAKKTKSRSKRLRIGETERIAERRMKAIGLRRARATYRQVAKELEVSVSTAFEDVQAELAVSEIERAQEAGSLRTEEVDHLDAISRALWTNRSDPPSARALISASQRRAHLLGLDTQTTGVSAEEIIQMAAALVSIIQAHVRDQRILDAIADQFEATLERFSSQRTALLSAAPVDHSRNPRRLGRVDS